MPAGHGLSNPLIVSGRRLYLEAPQTGAKEEIVSVNGIKGTDIAAALAKRVGNDGCLADDILLVNDDINVSGQIVSAMIGVDGPYDVITVGRNSEKQLLRTLKATSHWKSQVRQAQFDSKEALDLGAFLKEQGFNRPVIDPAVHAADLDYRFSEQRNLAYLSIKSFAPMNRAKKGVDLVMRDLIKRNPDALFVDLIGNNGGAIMTAQLTAAFLLPKSHRLFSKKIMRDVSRKMPANFTFFDEDAEEWRRHNLKYFRKIKPRGGLRTEPTPRRSLGKPDYKGPIYLLVNPESRSSSVRLASVLKLLRGVTIVGTTTAASPTVFCAKASGRFTLKNSGFRLLVPDVCFKNPEAQFNPDRRLAPDIVVSPMDVELAKFRTEALRAAFEAHDKSLAH